MLAEILKYQMTEPKLNGIYFIQNNMKESGFYYSEDKDGKTKYNEFKDPTFFEKLGSIFSGKKDFREEPRSTSYWLFSKISNKFIFQRGAIIGDSVSVAKSLKKNSYSRELKEIDLNSKGQYFYVINNFEVTLNFVDNGYSLNVNNKDINSGEITKQYFNFLDWTNL